MSKNLLTFFRENPRVRAAYRQGWAATRVFLPDDREATHITKRITMRAAALYARQEQAKPDVVTFLLLGPASDDMSPAELEQDFGPAVAAIHAELDDFPIFERQDELADGTHGLSPLAAEAAQAIVTGCDAEETAIKVKIAAILARVEEGMAENTQNLRSTLRRLCTVEAALGEQDKDVNATATEMKNLARLAAFSVTGLKPC